MARLTRKNIKVFAGNAANNGVFGSLQAGNPVTTTNVEQIQSLSAWNTGWNSATMTSEKLPPLEEFQGIQYVTTYQQAYIMQEGVPEWASTVTYYKGCLAKEVTSTGFRIYNSLTDDNTGNLFSDTSKWKKVMDSDDLYAFDNAVVHKAGTETITGQKTFTDDVVAKINYSRGTAPESSAYPKPYLIYDTNNKMFGCIQLAYLQNQAVLMELLAYNGANASDDTPASMGVVNNNGNKYTFAPTPTEDTTNSTQIDTVGARNTKLANYVALTGNQTIGGTKTFSSTISGSINGNAATVTNGVYTTGSQSIAGKKTFTNMPYIAMTHPSIHEQKTELTKGTAPTSSQDTSGGISFVDKNDKILADVLFGYTKDKSTLVALRPHKANASGDTAVSALSVTYPATGNPYATAPASDIADSVVTTINKSKAANGYFQLGNGLIIQWGSFSTSGTITLPKAFTSTDYKVACSETGDHEYGPRIGNLTKTTFDVLNSRPGMWIAIGY